MARVEGRYRWARAAWNAAFGLILVAGVVGGPAVRWTCPPRAGACARAAPAPVPKIGVVDFYALSPLPAFLSLTPQGFVADDLAGLLGRAGTDRIMVLPRSDVMQAQRALGWRTSDVMKYARMADLAQRLGADRLAVGWIRGLNVEREGDHHRFFPGSDFVWGSADLQVQVFDAAQGRLIMSSEFRGTAAGFVPYLVAEEALHQALVPAVAPALAVLAGGAP